MVIDDGTGWRLRAAASSYLGFLAYGDDALVLPDRPRGSAPEASALLTVAQALSGCQINLVAIDMPLSHKPITARRTSDNLVSSSYGARQCGTHTPSAIRPGKVSDDLKAGFELAGYPLLTTEVHNPGLLEVYPHPALVELTNAEKRLPYKQGKVRNYWRSDTVSERRAKLVEVWHFIIAHLDGRIGGVADALTVPVTNAKVWEMKAFEDMLDAVVCAWVGVCALEGEAVPFGDDTSAIWIPKTPS
ncbi:hypothetical protein ACO34A_10370 [Rhizobium sp. ACO-34A]|nr:DUF429 domain-containing protein [Rhizobium sp. ACO-34A]ATN34204.1 hypothetical protein ACO34A_10370 [Rhizobium sp. ACO-34A]